MEILYPEIAQSLELMFEADQKVRQHKEDGEKIATLDSEHISALKSIIQQIGWPTISKVGEGASRAAWLIVQHAGVDLAFQEECFELMKQVKDDIDPGDLEHLARRIQENKIFYGKI